MNVRHVKDFDKGRQYGPVRLRDTLKMECQVYAMAEKKKHSAEEIATKLAHAQALARQGKLQGEIARILGVSIMTLHRWRKTSPGSRHASLANHGTRKPECVRTAAERIGELQVENSRLRRLVTDLLLEKIKLEEAAQSKEFFDERQNSPDEQV